MADTPWRTGRNKFQRIYAGDVLIGCMYTTELASQVVRAVNNEQSGACLRRAENEEYLRDRVIAAARSGDQFRIVDTVAELDKFEANT